MFLTYKRDYESRLTRAMARATERKMRRWNNYMTNKCQDYGHWYKDCPKRHYADLFTEAKELTYRLRDAYFSYTDDEG